MMALVALNCLNLIQDNFVRLYCNSCHISVHLKKSIKIGEFLCSYFDIKMEGSKPHFWHTMLYYFKKGKNATEMQKKRFVQCMEQVL